MDKIRVEENSGSEIPSRSNNDADVFHGACNEFQNASQKLEESLTFHFQEMTRDAKIIPQQKSREAISVEVTFEHGGGHNNAEISNIVCVSSEENFNKLPDKVSYNNLCVVCSEEIGQEVSNADEEIIIYFVEKLFAFSLLQSFKNYNEESSQGLIHNLRHRWGSPVTWISFCSSCIQLIKDAKELFIQILQLEAQLNVIRETVTNKVNGTFDINNSIDNHAANDQSCFNLFRNCIRQMNGEKPRVIGEIINPSTLVEVKSECPSDPEDFDETGIKWITEAEVEGLMGHAKQEDGSSSLDSIQLADIIIDPTYGKSNEQVLVTTVPERKDSSWDKVENSKQASHVMIIEESSLQCSINQRTTRSQSRANQDQHSDKDAFMVVINPEKSESFNQLTGSSVEVVNAAKEEPDRKPTRKKCKKSQAGKRTIKRELDSGKSSTLNAALSIEIKDHRGMGKCSIESKTCPVCKRVFLNPSKMAVHYNIKHDRKILFNCEVCNRGFMRKDYLREHMKVHLTPEEKILERSLKERGVRKPRERMKPKITEASEDKPSCLICKTGFEDFVHLQRHINYFHGKTEGYTCEVCRKKFQWKDALRKHMRLHEGTKQFKCDYDGCESAFYYKKHLEVHQRIHTGTKDFLCALCGISFRHEWSFNRHNIFKHHKVTSKTYLCETCGKSFKIKSHLDQHLQSKSHGGSGLKRRKRSRAKASNNSSSSRIFTNVESDNSQITIKDSVSSTVSGSAIATATNNTLSSAHLSISHATQTLLTVPKSQSTIQQLPTLVLATNLGSLGSLSRIQSQNCQDRVENIPLTEINEVRSNPNTTTTCNGLQISINSSSSGENEYLSYISTMTNTTAHSHGLSLNLQTRQLKSPTSSHNINSSMPEESSTFVCESLPIVGNGSQLNSTIISDYQNNYSNSFNFVIAGNDQHHSLVQQNPQ